MIRRSASHRQRIAFAIIVLCVLAPSAATARPRAPRKLPRLVLHAADGTERMVTVEDLSFAYFRRIFYTRAASPAGSLSRERIEVQDRREECSCLRLSDWSKIKFGKLRQIEVVYPEGSRLSLLRLTGSDGRVSEVSAGALFGAADPFPPRFGATVEGLYREFPLVLEDSLAGGWPRERLSRILLVTSSPSRRSRSGRS